MQISEGQTPTTTTTESDGDPAVVQFMILTNFEMLSNFHFFTFEISLLFCELTMSTSLSLICLCEHDK